MPTAPGKRSSRAFFARSRPLAVGFAVLTALSAGPAPLPDADVFRRSVTDRRIESLGRQLVRYYFDARAWPASFLSLVSRPAGVTRWAGSYVPVRFSDFEDRREAAIRDGWGRKLVLQVSGFDAFLYSRGPNGLDEGGQGDDRGRSFNADGALWMETKREIRGITAMIGAWKREHPNQNLPSSFEGSYNQMRGDGFLPATRPAWKRDYWTDGWGTKYEIVKGGTPQRVIGVRSSGRP